jgi:hypothetical protein
MTMRRVPGGVSSSPEIITEDWRRIETALDVLATTLDAGAARATEETIYEYFRRRDSAQASWQLRILATLVCTYLADGWLCGTTRQSGSEG